MTAPAVPDPTVIGSPAITGPIGLGFRVPMLIISPFSRGGLVSSDLFDHTSVLRFLETLFGAEVPNLSAWRRATVGDLTSALNFKKPDQSIPNLPPTLACRSAGDPAMCREPGWNDTLHSAKHADRSDAGIRNRDSSERSVLVRTCRELARLPGWHQRSRHEWVAETLIATTINVCFDFRLRAGLTGPITQPQLVCLLGREAGRIIA